MANGSRLFSPYVYAPDTTGAPVAGALLYSYNGDSTAPGDLLASYADAGLTVPNANPVVANSAGIFPAIFLDPAIVYTFKLTWPVAQGGVQIWTAYPVQAPNAEDLNSYSATGTNAIVLTPINGTPTSSGYSNYQQFVFLAPNSSTGPVTVRASGLAAYPLYSGASQVDSGQLTAGQLVVAIYTSNWNATSTPGFVLVSAATLDAVVTAADSGSANTYVMAPTAALAAYSTQQLYRLQPANTNTGAATLNISGNGAKPIWTTSGNPVGIHDLMAGAVYLLTYNSGSGGGFVVLNPSRPYAGPRFQAIAGNAAGGTKTASWGAANVMMWYNGTDAVCSGVATFNLNINTNGANGLDTGAVAASTPYYVYAIYGATGLACLASLSATAPTMPSGYTAWGRIGSVVMDGSTNIRAFRQLGARTQFINTGSGVPQLASGVAGVNTGTYVAIPLGAFVPAVAQSVTVYAYSAVDVVGVAPNNSYGAYNSSTNSPPIDVIMSGGTGMGELVLESTNLYWFSTGAAGSVHLLAYTDNF